MSYDYLFKYIVVGNSSVGKSCISSRFQNDIFCNNHEVTIGVEFFSKIIQVETLLNNQIKNFNIKLQIWDTAGQEEYRALIRSYYRGTAGCILVFDITNKKSFLDIVYWLETVKYNSINPVEYILVGNKIDLSNSRKVSYQEADELAKKYNMNYFETSALNSRNIFNMFYNLTQNILEKVITNKICLSNNTSIKKGRNRLVYYTKYENTDDDSCCF